MVRDHSEASKCIVDALEFMGCPHSVEAFQMQKLEFGSIYPVVKWLVSDPKVHQGPRRNEVISTIHVNAVVARTFIRCTILEMNVEKDSTRNIESFLMAKF